MKDALLQQNTKGRILRVLVSLCVFAIVSISAFTVFEFGFADENDSKNLIYDISLHNDDGISGSSYGFASNPDVRPIEISAKGGQVNLRCVAWWGDGSTTTNNEIVGLTITSSDYNIVTVDGFTVTALHDGEATLTVTVSDHTQTGEPIVLEVPVIITGQDKPYVESITISCDSIYYDEDSYKAMGYMLIDELTDLSGLYLDFYAIVEVKDPSDGTVVYYDSRDGLLSDLSDGNLADLSWCLTDSTMAEVSPYGQIHPTEYGNNSIWVVSSSGLDGYVFSGTMSYHIPSPEQSIDGWGPQDTITFNIWYENDSEYSDNGNFTMPSDPNLVKTVTYDENDLVHVGTFTETYTLIAGANLASVTAQGYGADLENLLVQVCGLDSDQGTSAIQTLRFYDPSGAYKQMSASWLFQTRYYYPNIDIGSKAYAVAVRPMLAFDSWWQRGFPVNWDAPMSDSNRYRLLLGSTDLKESVTGFSWKWTNRIDVILESGQQTGDNKYIVNFDSQGGSEVGSQAVDIGGYANDPIAPEKSGYTFTGWYSKDGTLFDFNNTPITGNITLYAGWQEGESQTTVPDETPHDPGSSGSESGGEPDTGDSDNSDNTGSTGNSGNSGNDDVSDSIGAGTGGAGSSNGGFGSAGSLGGGAGNAEGTASGGTGGLLSDGTGTGGTGESLDAFYSSESSPDATEAGQSTFNDAGLGEGATEGTGSGLDETSEIGTGRYSLYQVMNPFTSDIGVEHEDNPLDPFVVPVSCGVVALGAVQSALWFAMQRRQTRLLAATGADAA